MVPRKTRSPTTAAPSRTRVGRVRCRANFVHSAPSQPQTRAPPRPVGSGPDGALAMLPASHRSPRARRYRSSGCRRSGPGRLLKRPRPSRRAAPYRLWPLFQRWRVGPVEAGPLGFLEDHHLDTSGAFARRPPPADPGSSRRVDREGSDAVARARARGADVLPDRSVPVQDDARLGRRPSDSSAASTASFNAAGASIICTKRSPSNRRAASGTASQTPPRGEGASTPPGRTQRRQRSSTREWCPCPG